MQTAPQLALQKQQERTARGPSSREHVLCPTCCRPGKRVGVTTLQALLKEEHWGRICAAEPAARGDFQFCGSRNCDVVYFDPLSTTTFTHDHLRVPVGIKQTKGERPLCYCFGYSVASIKDELRAKGKSDACDEIHQKMNDPGCRCETKNPSGSCCLADVAHGARTALEELNMSDLQHATSTRSCNASTGRPEKIATAGALVSAIAASACCWLPPVLLSIGLSGAGVASTLEAHRATLAVISTGFLAAAFFFTYWNCKDASAHDPSEPGDCCAADGRPHTDRLKQVLLWAATGLVVVFLFAPRDLVSLLGFLEGAGCCAVPEIETDAQSPAPIPVQTSPVQSPPAAGAKQSPAQAVPAHPEAATLTILSDDVHELKTAFNEDKDAAKVLLIVSPVCPMCRYGARVVEEQALTQIAGHKLKIYVVWIKRLFRDNRDAAQKAMELVPDKRARHFWDGSGSLGKQYGKILDLPGERHFAWDVYMVFDPKTRWGETPPAPSFWMHQLGGRDTGNRLDGGRFRDAIRQRLPK